MRWYVEPAFADQRAFNDAVLKLIDDLDERIARLERLEQQDEDRGLRGRRCRSCAAAPSSWPTTSSRELRARGHEAETVTIPFKWYPGTRVLDQAFLWRLLDLTRPTGGRSTA